MYKSGYFIEVMLWNPFSILSFLRLKKKRNVLCIRFNDELWLCFNKKKPTLINDRANWKRSYWEKRIVCGKAYSVGKEYLRSFLNKEKTQPDKQILKEYIGLVSQYYGK